jgi:inositol phosphorylceramide synthase catalytic subunit
MSVVTSFATHVDQLWGRRFWLPLLPLAYATIMGLLGYFRWEYILVAGGTLVGAFATRRSRDFVADVAPYILFAVLYDFVKYVIAATITPDRIITCGLRRLELALFSVAPGVTPQDYFMAHPKAVLDLIFAVPYAVFFVVVFLYGGYLFRIDRPRMRFFLWSFALANIMAFICWTAFPAAAPWYVRHHGCIADLATPPNAAGLVRVDRLIGFPYFQSFYARASQVFGALPSMHCAYPMLGLLTAWRFAGPRARFAHLTYVIVMFSASVYLDHHWIIDGILGWAMAVVAVFAARRMFARLGWPISARAPRGAEPESPLLTA